MAAPNINSISPNTGLPSVATAVIITGTGFTGATAVTFHGVTATNIVEVSDTEITCDTPQIVFTATVDVTVTTPSGSNTMFNGFTYEHPGTPAGPEAFFPAFTPIIPPPPFGLPPPPTFPPTTGTTPVKVPVGPLVGPAIRPAPVPPSLAGVQQPQFKSGSATLPASYFPDFTTTFPNPPVSIQTTPPPPNMIVTTPPVGLVFSGTEEFGEDGEDGEDNDNALSLHHGDAEFPERRAGAVLQSAHDDELHQSRPPQGGRSKRLPKGRTGRHHHKT
jgi:hypothetical protein